MLDRKDVERDMSKCWSKKRRALIAVFVCIAATGLLELACFLFLLVNGATVFYWSTLQDRRNKLIENHAANIPAALSEDPVIAGDSMVPHPYLGFTRDPLRDASTNQYGFRGRETNPLQRRSPDKVIIGIAGGDVAEQFFHDGLPALRTLLNKSASFATKQFVFVNLACPSYKQPQQLMAVNYMLALGAEFDILINIDGFNEVALNEAENAIHKVSPVFPRNWYLLNSNIPDPYLRQLVGHEEYLQSEIASLASAMSIAPLRFSATWNTIWSIRHRHLTADCIELQNKIRTYSNQSQVTIPFWISGPKLNESPEDDGHTNLLVWAESSLQLHYLCRENHTRYYHFLQPSPYVVGSKPMEAAERAVAVIEGHPFGRGAARGYPWLIAASKQFARLGVRFTNLTGVFADVKQPLYLDAAGRLAKEGHEIIAKHVSQAILGDDS